MAAGESDMTGKTVVVTGGNSGIGLETAVELGRMGARVIITARSQSRGEAAVATIAQRILGPGAIQGGSVELSVFDLGDLASVRRGTADLLSRCPRLDVLVNNAGLVLTERSQTVDGYESTFAINHLGPFLLTTMLVPRLLESAPARIVNVSSTAHNTARRGMSFDDLQSKHGYSGMRVYGESKLANILFALELTRRYESQGLTANSLHPGTVRTGYGADGDAKGFLALGIRIAKPFFLSPARGARTSIYLASSPDVADVSGNYFVKCKARSPRRWAQDADAARRLWNVSEALVGAGGKSATDPAGQPGTADATGSAGTAG
jgi:NAD(P)-dependent dehydrogenase (short-subunit alcohol dehydrogenase family)